MRRVLLASILVFLISGVASANGLSEAMDTNLIFDTGGDADWFSQTRVSYFDGDAAQSGDIWDGQESWMQTTVSGAGTLSFYWKVSSEANYDLLEFYIDGSLHDRISGSMDWQQVISTISGSGTHTLEWRYVKDSEVSNGNDLGRVDLVEWSSGSQPPSEPLSEALDTNASFTTNGDVGWFSQTAIAYFGGDAAQSGDIMDSQESLMQTTVSGVEMVSFFWKVSSEAGYDFLEFYIDGILQDSISGSVDWQQMVYTISDSESHTLEWRYLKDYSVSEGDDSGWIDFVELVGGTQPPSGPLSEALDTNLSFITAGDAGWFSQTAIAIFDGDAAQSGVILDNQESLLQTTVSGAGTVSFYWKVSSEGSYDFLEFYIDGVLQERISGSVDWQQMMYTISGSGLHTLDWRYVKDESFSSDSDSGWVDQVEWSGGTQPPAGPLSEAMDTNLSFTTEGGAEWFSQTATAIFDGDAAQSGDISDNQDSLVQSMVSGAGTLSFFWKVSSEAGYDFLEFYIDGVLQERISGSVDWHQMIYTITESGSHSLEWRYVKDASVSEGDDSGWVDQVEWGGGTQPPAGDPLSEAMDTNMSFTTAGDAEWFSQTEMVFFDGDAAQSGDISDNQQSSIQTTVSGAGTLSFFWKVSSEVNYDFLEFYIDGVLRDSISGSEDWQQMIYTIAESGSHTLEWHYVTDWSESAGDDSGWVDQVEWTGGTQPSSGSLSEALDTSMSFSTGGNADWYSQTTTFYNDWDAAQSGGISHNQESWMRTTISGSGTLSFFWKVSSEPGYDHLEFYIDGSLQDRISGLVDWQQILYTLSWGGAHELEWRYVKDWSVSEGDDSGWVDALVVD